MLHMMALVRAPSPPSNPVVVPSYAPASRRQPGSASSTSGQNQPARRRQPLDFGKSRMESPPQNGRITNRSAEKIEWKKRAGQYRESLRKAMVKFVT